MKNYLVFLLVVSCIALLHQQASAAEEKKAYIVYLGSHSYGPEATLQDYDLASESHYDLLGSFLGSKEQAQSAIFYSYRKNINGFAAMLDEEEAQQIAKHPNVISVFPDIKIKLHTTQSWHGLGMETDDGKVLPESIWSKANYGEDVIIGNLDTGVWPESKSFKDNGMGPVPTRWKGFCQNNTKEGVPCNRKLIGARYFKLGTQANDIPLSTRDTEGHGTHTLSTAGGSFVPGANIFERANGTAKGGSPKARVAAYKVCWPKQGCGSADILAGFEAAIHDGVDVISVSVGGLPDYYFRDPAAIGSFHAVQSGITVVCSAGNEGPNQGSVSNVAPWVVTVAASTIDRSLPSVLVLGNGKNITGESAESENLKLNSYPLINAADAKFDNVSALDASLCIAESIDPKKVKGKIVVCLRGQSGRLEKGMVVQKAGGAALVLVNDLNSGDEILADPHFLPATMITYKDGITLQSYMNSTKSPVAYISKPLTRLGTKPAPKMAAFSSRGPNIVTPQILKPDITAPGVSVLAAYTEGNSPSELPEDKRRVPFTLMSGTSMSCPHVSGVVGLLKKLHPKWSPAAIRSAIMTTGHIRPNRAMDPGLVYDLTMSDYLNFLCALGYNSGQLSQFYGKTYSCPAKPVNIEDLNYPSITVANLTKSATVVRTVKNVGAPGTYRVRVQSPYGITVSVKPEILKFVNIGEEKSFNVTLETRNGGVSVGYVFGGLIWSDGKHQVRTPLVVNALA